MRRTSPPTLVAVFALLLGSACSVDPEEYPLGDPPSIKVMALSAGETADGLLLDSAWVSLADLTFVPCDPAAASLGTKDFPIELLRVPPSDLTLDSAVTDYCRIHVELAPSKLSTPSDLEDKTVLIAGQRADDSAFVLSSTQALEMDFSSSSRFVDVSKLVLGVDTSAWFADAGVNDAELTDDTALIDAESNPDVLAAFEASTSVAFSLYVDTNGDGELTDEELSPVATAATR